MLPAGAASRGGGLGRLCAALLGIALAVKVRGDGIPSIPTHCKLVPADGKPGKGAVLAPGTCFTDPQPPDGQDPVRLLHPGVKGCCGTGCEGSDSAQPLPHGLTCDGQQMTPTYCAAACWAALDGSVAAVGLEAGDECYCSAEWPVTTQAGVKPQQVSGCSQPCNAQKDTMCGGNWKVSVWRIECGAAWGTHFLVFVLVAAILYLGIGAGYQYKMHGASTLETLIPHRQQWQQLIALCTDGAVFARQRLRGQPDGKDEQLLGPRKSPVRASEIVKKAATSTRNNRETAAQNSDDDMFGDDNEIVE